jgi:hypothetical protein
METINKSKCIDIRMYFNVSLFIPVRARTRALSDAPLTRAISLLNRLSEDVDLFNVDHN